MSVYQTHQVSNPSFFFYDYETTGIDPKRDRIIQFAGVRTDLDFNIISDPIAIYSKLSEDIIPNPEALLVTGITPDVLNTEGRSEIDFLRVIYKEFAAPATCVLGFNNIRFDDEFTRYAFYRNFYDPYAREWQNNNSRFDLIDVVRMCAALRPDNINWPKNPDNDNKVSFKLTELTKANGLDHYKAHDALSDVYATIALAKLIQSAQPKLFNYLLSTRKKDFVSKVVNILEEPIVHSTRMVKSEYFGTSVFLPLFRDPNNPNGIITWDLRYDPEILLNLPDDIELLKNLLYTPIDKNIDQNIGQPDKDRLYLKTIFINKAPAVAPLNTLDQASYQRLQLERDKIFDRAELIKLNYDKWHKQLLKLFNHKIDFAATDVEQQLYDKFISNNDRLLCNRVHVYPEDKLKELEILFNDSSDPRLGELLFRYRARNYYNTLSSIEQKQWQEYCQSRWSNTNKLSSISKQEFIERSNIILNDSNMSLENKQIIKKWLDSVSTL